MHRYLNISLIIWILTLFATNIYAQTNSNTPQHNSNQSTSPIASLPNILFILVDDLGWNDIGFHATSSYATPNIDNLAQNYGLQLNNYYVQSQCSASRSALLSGRYPIKTGMQHEILNPNDPYGLPLNFTLLSQDLQQAGYDTFLFGKWHLGFFNEHYTPTFRGWNQFYGFYNDMEDFYNHTVTVINSTKYDLFDNTNPVNDSMLNTYSTYIYRNKTLDAFRQYNANSDANKKPMFIYLSLQNVHSPLQAPPNTDSVSTKRKIKAAKTIIVDNVIGDIVQYSNDTGLWDNLLIIFSTDNGAPSNDGGSNYPLRGSKGTLWEGSLRGTAFISGGYLNSLQYGGITNELIHITDFYPTIMDIVNVTATDNDQLDGKSFINVVENKNGKSIRNETLLNIDPVHCNNIYSVCGAIRIGDWKLIVGNIGSQVTKLTDACDATWCSNTDESYRELNELSTLTPTRSPVQCDFAKATGQTNQSWKDQNILYNHCPFNGEPCLFNITNDPCEFFDVKTSHPDILNQTMQRLQFYMTQTVTPLSILNIPVDPANMYPNIDSKYWTPWKNTSSIIMWNTNTQPPTASAPTTFAPTISPTIVAANTSAPSKNPTLSPSITPIVSIINTTNPTQSPSINPTQSPSTTPTISVINTTNPTKSPSINPTQSPSINPTQSPSINPTQSPLINPTLSPSTTPTVSVINTTNPTKSPSINPTEASSINQTEASSINPTEAPSRSPTFNPTQNPAIAQTVNPTNSPSLDPSHNPTESPSESPSRSPTFNPTKNPTILRTLKPTNFPSIDPTISPLKEPTGSPTAAPTKSPLTVVTEVASIGKNTYMTAFYLVSIFSILVCICLIIFGFCWRRHRRNTRMRHTRLQDSLKGIELRPIAPPQRGGGEYSGLLD